MRVEWRRRPLFFAALLLSAGILATQPKLSRELPEKEGLVFLGGRIVSEVESREIIRGTRRDYFILNVERSWEGLGSEAKNARGRVRVSWRNAPVSLDYGDVVVLEGELSPFSGRRNPGGFDAASFWKVQRVAAAFYAKESSRSKVFARGKGNPVRAWAIRVKKFLSRRISEDFDGDASAFLKALFLGERSDLDQDFKDLFLKTGTMHILAVSGFNIGFLGGVLWLFLKPFPVPRNGKLFVLLAAAWAYCLIVGWQAPVVRATLMATVFLLGNILGRKTDGLNALGLAACVILILNPLQLFDVGFQLSFLSVFGLITLAPVFLKRQALLPHETWTWEEKLSHGAQELFWVSFICYFLTLPVTVQNFYLVTPYALLANLAVVPLSFLLFFLGVPYFFIPWAAAPMKLIIAGLVKALFFIENLPGSVWIVGKPWAALGVLLACGIAYLFFSKRFSSRRVRAAAVVLFCANVFLAQEVLRLSTRRFEMTMLDVGQGEAVYFEFPEGGNLLIDAGAGRFTDQGRFAVGPFLKSKGIRSLDAAVLSHPQEDHVGGFSTVLKDFKVKNVFHAGVPYDSFRWKTLQKELQNEGSSVEKVRRGDEIEGYPGARMSVLHPEPEAAPAKNINDACVVLKIVHEGRSFLLTGDIQEKAIRSLLASGLDLSADVLKVPHHGGKTGPSGAAFIQAVSPSLSLISSGARNPFGHPRPETLAALETVPGNRILRTDRSGALRLILEGGRILLDGSA